MGDIKSARLIYIKGFLFLLMGVMAGLALIMQNPNLRDTFLLLVAIWSFARFYYFAFYVIEHYVDSGYRFAGLWSFCLYLFHQRSDPDRKPPLRDEPSDPISKEDDHRSEPHE